VPVAKGERYGLLKRSSTCTVQDGLRPIPKALPMYPATVVVGAPADASLCGK